MALQQRSFPPSSQRRRSNERNASLARDLVPIQTIMGRDLNLQTIAGNLLSLDVAREHLLAVCRFLRDQLGFELLSSISGVDFLDHLETVYHVRALSRHDVLQLRVRVDTQQPEVESVVSIWPGANWLEREVYDLFGIRFLGHPDLRRLLLDDDFVGYPLLKSFQSMPPVIKNRATTQVPPTVAVAGTFETQGYEQVVLKRVGQGREERLHPGTPTFGDTQQHAQAAANLEQATPSGESAPQPD